MPLSIQANPTVLVAFAALALGACSATPSDDTAGVTTDPSGTSSTSPSSAGETETNGATTSTSLATAVTTSESGESGEDPDTSEGPKLDLMVPDMMPPPSGDCEVTLADPAVLDDYPECPIMVGFQDVCWYEAYWGCVALEPGFTCEELCPDGDCVSDWTNCMGDMPWGQPSEVCGPYEFDGMCCSLGEIIGGCAE